MTAALPKVLAIGTYDEAEHQALGAVTSLDPAVRHAITAVAFKGYTGDNSFDRATMEALPNLALIANYGVGYDAIDVEAATALGIRITNTPDVLDDDVADLAVAMLLMQGREMQQAAEWARSGRWETSGEYRLNRKISGGRAGIVGLGRIGREIAHRLAAFKMDIHYFSRRPKETPGWTWHANPVSLARAVDYLIIALVGGAATRGFVSAQVIKALGPKGILVNISRGSTVDEPALLEALENGGIAGAGLDVFWNEPKIDPRFYRLGNVVIQPHQGSGTTQTRTAMGRLQSDNIRAFLRGAPLVSAVN